MKLIEMLEKIKESNLKPNEKLRGAVYCIYVSFYSVKKKHPLKSEILNELIFYKYFNENNKIEEGIFADLKLKELKYPPYHLLSIFAPCLECATSKISPLEVAYYYHNLLTRWKGGEGNNMNFSVQFHLNTVKDDDKKEYETLLKMEEKTDYAKRKIKEIESNNKNMYSKNHLEHTGRKISRNKVCQMNQYFIDKGLIVKDSGDYNQMNKLIFVETGLIKIIQSFSADMTTSEKDIKDIEIINLKEEIKNLQKEIYYLKETIACNKQ